MADLVCSFFCFRSLTTNYSLPLFLPPRNYYASALHSHNSRIARIKRTPAHLLPLFRPSQFAAPASEIDVISTHEHPDGSLIFRFGDPSEIQENVESEASKNLKEEIEGEHKEESSVVKVKEGTDETELIVSGLTEASDHADSIVRSSNTATSVVKLMESDDETELIVSGSIEASERADPTVSCNNTSTSMVKVMEGDDETESIASGLTEANNDGSDSIVSNSTTATSIEGESQFYDKSFEGLDDVELPVLTSYEELRGTSSPDLDIETSENVEDINEEQKDLSPVGASTPDESTAEVSYEESLEETSNVTYTSKETEITSTPSVDVGQLIVNVEECLNQEDSPADAASILDQSSELVDNVPTVALLEKESDDIISADIGRDQSGKVDEFLNGDNEDSSLGASVLDESSSGMMNGDSPVALSEKETDGVSSNSDIEVQPTGNVEEFSKEEYEDSPVDVSVLDKSSGILNRDSTVALLEKETTDGIISTSDVEIEPTGNVEEFTNEEYEDSLVDTSVLDKRSEVISDITTEASSEKETADVTSVPGTDTEHTGNVEQGIGEILEESSSVVASIPNESSEVENNINAQDILGEETADAITLVAFKSDPVDAVLETDAYQGSLESAVTTNAVLVSEHQDVEPMVEDETTSDGIESSDDNLVSPSPQLEPCMSLYEETEKSNLQAELQTLATEESSESDVNNLTAIEMQNVLRNDNESDMYGAEAEPPMIEPAMTGSVGSDEQASGSGSGMPSETVGYVGEEDMIQLLTLPPHLEADSMHGGETSTETVEEQRENDASEDQKVGGDLVEDPVNEVMAPEYTEPSITSQEMLMTDFVLSSGAVLLPHPSKVLTGGEDAYFIAGQTWLGVADGVSQWSLEGTIHGVYAEELIKNCERLVCDCNGNSVNSPIELLNLSVAQTDSPGSSTVLIAQFDGQALHVANVGNSGFIVLRHGSVYKRSSPMHHAFSLPVQIERGDDPSSLAQMYRVDLELEDLIITATDGLLDNLYDQEILLISMKSLADNRSLEEIAELLGKKAQEIGSSASSRCPFGDEAQAAGFPGYTGGNLDDVAVIVSVVRRR